MWRTRDLPDPTAVPAVQERSGGLLASNACLAWRCSQRWRRKLQQSHGTRSIAVTTTAQWAEPQSHAECCTHLQYKQVVLHPNVLRVARVVLLHAGRASCLCGQAGQDPLCCGRAHQQECRQGAIWQPTKIKRGTATGGSLAAHHTTPHHNTSQSPAQHHSTVLVLQLTTSPLEKPGSPYS